MDLFNFTNLTTVIAGLSILIAAFIAAYLKKYNLWHYPDMDAYAFYGVAKFYQKNAMPFRLSSKHRQSFIEGAYKPNDRELKSYIFDCVKLIHDTNRDCWTLIIFLLLINLGLFFTNRPALLILTYIFLICISWFVVKVKAFYILAAINPYKKHDWKEINSILIRSLPNKINIYQLKKLLDDGVITQDDFDAKKKSVLGI